MDFALKRETAPASLAVSLAELKKHVHELSDDFDDLLTAILEAAISHVEGVLGRSLVTQTWQLYLDCFPRRSTIKLPMGPVASVTSIKYTPSDGTEQTFDSEKYVVWAANDSLSLKLGSSWPGVIVEPGSVVIEYDAGGDAADVDEAEKLLIKLLAAHWYRTPEAVVTGTISKEVEMSFNAVLHARREHWTGP